MSGRWERIAAVARLELTIQRREPLSVLYMLVFGLLGAAFAAAGPVELVRGRGPVARDAAWSLMLASTALTAFGQVITTMVAATVVLRDRADRVSDLITVTSLTAREYLSGKLLAALIMLCVIYSAIPAGLLLGSAFGGGSLSQAATGSVRPFLFLVIPTMLSVGGLQFAVGVLSGRLWAIVGQGLLLIWMWNAAIDATGDGTPTMLALMMDPFGSAPVLHATQAWTDVQRGSLPMPLTDALILNRLVWVVIGGGAAGLAILSAGRSSGLRESARSAVMLAVPVVPARDGIIDMRQLRATSTPAWRSAAGTAGYVVRWMLRDTGWRVLAALGAMNVCVHAWLDARGASSALDLSGRTLAAVVLHARMFLILLATIYAGELVWREREERSAPLFDAVPVRDAALISGRIGGALVSQAVLLVVLGVSAALAAMISAGRVLDVVAYGIGIVREVGLPFVLWLLLALSVQAVVQQKVISHLLMIAGWVLWVAVTGSATASSRSDVWWVGAALLAVAVTGLGWTRGVSGRRWWFRRVVVSGTENL